MRAIVVAILCNTLLLQYGVRGQVGLGETRVTYKDYRFPTYAQPWSIGRNVCPYLKDADGNQIYTTCFPYKQKMCGQNTEFVYDCCPGFKEDIEYENIPPWRYRKPPSGQGNCLKAVPRDASPDAEMRRLKVPDEVVNYVKNVNTGGQPTTYFVETGNAYRTAKYSSQGKRDNPSGHVAKGIHKVKHLPNGESLTSMMGDNEQIKVTRYSNGIICVNCAKLVSVNHPAKNSVIHFVDRHIYNTKGQTTGALLQSKYAYFWNAVPDSVKASLQGRNCRKWYTVFVPPRGQFESKLRGQSDEAKARLALCHIVPSMICSAAVVQKSRTAKNLNNERLELGCARGGGRYVKSLTSGRRRSNFKKVQGEYESMTSNGVVYEVDNPLVDSGVEKVTDWSYIDQRWRQYIRECVNLEDTKRYIFIVPTERGLNWFLRSSRSSRFAFNDEERLRDFRTRFQTDAEYRCFVIKYHILEAGDKKTSLKQFWSQFYSQNKGFYSSLGVVKKYNERDPHLDLFMRQDDASQLLWQYSYARDFQAYPVREGHVYEIDYVNVPPEEKVMDFLKRRTDVRKFYGVINSKENTVKLYARRKPVQLILAFADETFSFNKLKSRWNVNDFLAIHTANIYFWIGKMGYLAAGERSEIGSGNPNATLFVYRDNSDKYYVWVQAKNQKMSMDEAARSWTQVIYFNYWKMDAMVWILKNPLKCKREFCRRAPMKLELAYFFGFGCTEILGAADKRKIQHNFKDDVRGSNKTVWETDTFLGIFGPPSVATSTVCMSKAELAFKPRLEGFDDQYYYRRLK